MKVYKQGKASNVFIDGKVVEKIFDYDIDKGYRGDIRARVFCMPHDPIQYQGNQVICNSKKFNIAKGMRLFQICAKDLSPFDVKFVDQLPDSIRGEGGFGSTGN